MTKRGAVPDLIIFDCDGVVLDSEIVSAEVLIELVAQQGISTDLQYVYRNCLGRSFPTVAKRLGQQFDIELGSDFEARYRENLFQRFETELREMHGIRQVLDDLRIPFCLATSSSPQRVKKSLALVGLSTYFEGRVFTASQVENGKPAPDLFLFAAAQMDVPIDRCLVVEDSVVGVQAGLAADMAVLRFVGGGHIQGIDTATRLAEGTEFEGCKYKEFASFEKFSDLLSGSLTQARA